MMMFVFLCLFGSSMALLDQLEIDYFILRVFAHLVVTASVPILWISGNEKLKEKARSMLENIFSIQHDPAMND